MAEMRKWLVPPLAMRDDKPGHSNEDMLAMYSQSPLSELPDVLGALGTLRKRFHALNFGTDAAAKAVGSKAGGGKSNGKR